jgi:hypothetical protein
VKQKPGYSTTIRDEYDIDNDDDGDTSLVRSRSQFFLSNTVVKRIKIVKEMLIQVLVM